MLESKIRERTERVVVERKVIRTMRKQFLKSRKIPYKLACSNTQEGHNE